MSPLDPDKGALQRRLGISDARGPVGQMARGKPVYNAGTNNPRAGVPPRKGGPAVQSQAGYTAPPSSAPQPQGQTGQTPLFGETPQTPAPKQAASSLDARTNTMAPGMPDEGYQYRYNPQYEQAINDIMSQKAGINSEMELGERRLGQDLATQEDNFRQALERRLTDNEQRMAGQGILRSGINTAQQGEIGQDYTQQVNELNSNAARIREDMTRQSTAALQRLESMQSEIERQRALQEKQYREEQERIAAQNQAYQEAVRASQPQMAPTGQYGVQNLEVGPAYPYEALMRRLAL